MADAHDAIYRSDNSCAQDQAAAKRGLHGDEGGQISVFFVFATAALVILIALVFNTARQTTRKIEMQGAADGAAIAGGAWVARGMNVTALNNNSMAETLAIMITVRSLRQTSETLRPILEIVAGFIPPLASELAFHEGKYAFLVAADTALSESSGSLGWRIMSALDSFNKGIKRGFPKVAQAQAMRLAKMNGADQEPWGFLISGQRDYSLFPQLPLMRGDKRLITRRAKDCQLGNMKGLARIFFISGPTSAVLGEIIFDMYVTWNVWSLGGGSPLDDFDLSAWTIIRTMGLSSFLAPLKIIALVFALGTQTIGGGKPPLRWIENPPRPMILSDVPQADPEKTTDTTEEQVDLTRVRKHLQFLTLASGKQELGSLIGGERFQNPGWWRWSTYAQADVFNPMSWSMFSQEWRVKLVRAQMAEEHLGRLLKAPELKGKMIFINTH